MDNSEGAICHIHTHDSSATAGPFDFGNNYVAHVLPAAWSPPAMSAALTPVSTAISDAKYGLVLDPSSTATTAQKKYVLTEGYYATAQWYQPVPTTDYALLRRFGRLDRVAAYCISGSGSTSYFSQPQETRVLTSGIALVGGASALLASFIAF